MWKSGVVKDYLESSLLSNKNNFISGGSKKGIVLIVFPMFDLGVKEHEGRYESRVARPLAKPLTRSGRNVKYPESPMLTFKHPSVASFCSHFRAKMLTFSCAFLKPKSSYFRALFSKSSTLPTNGLGQAVTFSGKNHNMRVVD